MERTHRRRRSVPIKRRSSDNMRVDLTIHGLPASLLMEFGEKIVRPSYSGGVNEALTDLMRKAILEYDLFSDPVYVHSRSP